MTHFDIFQGVLIGGCQSGDTLSGTLEVGQATGSAHKQEEVTDEARSMH